MKRTGIYAILGFLALFVVLHLGFAAEQIKPRVIGTTMLGGIAFLMMTVSLLLSTRMPVFEEWFGGLDRMYQVHKVTGVLSALFVLSHFILVPKELPVGADALANPLLPSAPMGMFALVLLMIGLAVTLNRKIAYNRWKPTHKIMGLVYVLVIGHFMTAPAIFVAQFGYSGVMLMIAGGVGTLCFLYSIFGMNKRTAVAFVIDQVNAMERATEIVLKPSGAGINHRPGQFAFVEIAGKGWSEPHPFTIASAPGDTDLRFTMKVLGDWTRKVREELTPGTKVAVRGPYGRFDTTKAGRQQVWLAGGIGVTPFLSMLRAMEPGDDREIHLVYAVRNKDEALFLEEMQACAKPLGNVTIVPLYSEDGNFARVDIMKTKLAEPLTNFDYFLCGPKPMVEGLKKDLKAVGVKSRSVHTEAFEFR